MLDSGVSNQSCCSKDFFDLIEPYNSTIKVGDGRELQVNRIGTVDLHIKSKNKVSKLIIRDVLFAPELLVNLISIRKLYKKGCSVIFEKEICKIHFGQELVAECYTWDQNEPEIYLSNKNNDKWKRWHHRLGHLINKNMKKIRAKDVELNKKVSFNEFCEDCALGN